MKRQDTAASLSWKFTWATIAGIFLLLGWSMYLLHLRQWGEAIGVLVIFGGAFCGGAYWLLLCEDYMARSERRLRRKLRSLTESQSSADLVRLDRAGTLMVITLAIAGIAHLLVPVWCAYASTSDGFGAAIGMFLCANAGLGACTFAMLRIADRTRHNSPPSNKSKQSQGPQQPEGK